MKSVGEIIVKRPSYKLGIFIAVIVLVASVNQADAWGRRGGGGSRSRGGSGWSIFGRSKPKPQPKPSAPQGHTHTQVNSNYNVGHGSPGHSYPGSNSPYNPGHQTGSNYPGGSVYNPGHAAPGHYPNTPYGHPSGNPHSNIGFESYNRAPPPPYTPHGYPTSGMNHYGGGGFNHGYSPMGASQPQILQVQSSRPGVGQLVKEAVVFAGVNTAVNAAASRLIPGGIFGHSGHGVGSGAPVAAVPNTQITYNNYYNNGSAPVGNGEQGSAAPGAPSVAATSNSSPAATSAPADSNSGQAQNNANQPNYGIPTTELMEVSDSLFKKDQNNAMKHITMNLQKQKTGESTSDDAPERLLKVAPEAYEIPTVKAVVNMYDNYEFEVGKKETPTSETRREEEALLDAFLATDVMKETMKFLASKNFIPNDEFEFRDILRRIWFSRFKRIDSDPASSGFEVVYLAEKLNNDVLGVHNWIYYAKQEDEGKINYHGYFKELDLDKKGSIVQVQSTVRDTIQPRSTLFVGTSPELEMALYTICFYARPNDICNLSMGGAKFSIVSYNVNYFGKDILISALPDI